MSEQAPQPSFFEQMQEKVGKLASLEDWKNIQKDLAERSDEIKSWTQESLNQFRSSIEAQWEKNPAIREHAESAKNALLAIVENCIETRSAISDAIGGDFTEQVKKVADSQKGATKWLGGILGGIPGANFIGKAFGSTGDMMSNLTSGLKKLYYGFLSGLGEKDASGNYKENGWYHKIARSFFGGQIEGAVEGIMEMDAQDGLAEAAKKLSTGIYPVKFDNSKWDQAAWLEMRQTYNIAKGANSSLTIRSFMRDLAIGYHGGVLDEWRGRNVASKSETFVLDLTKINDYRKQNPNVTVDAYNAHAEQQKNVKVLVAKEEEKKEKPKEDSKEADVKKAA
jgi:hypothetical protein